MTELSYRARFTEEFWAKVYGTTGADSVAVENLQRRGDYVIIAFLREAVGERGGPHVSPLGAYDAESDSFLVLDVNPASTDWVWMPTKTLIKGMRTFDKIENRGYILVAPQ